MIRFSKIYYLSSLQISLDVTGNTSFLPIHIHCFMSYGLKFIRIVYYGLTSSHHINIILYNKVFLFIIPPVSFP